MQSIREYSSIVTKIRAMNRRLLDERDYESLIMSHSIVDIVAYLRQHQGYGRLFEKIDDIIYYRADVEKVLFKNVLTDYVKLYKFSDGKHRKFLAYYLKRYEIKILKLCLRMIYEGEMDYDLLTYKDFFDKYTNIDMGLLSGSSTIDEFIIHLRDTDYFDILRVFIGVAEPNLFDFETALDLHYFKNIWKHKSKYLSESEQGMFVEIVGVDIDMLNIQWIYRLKKHYDISGADIEPLLIPIHYKLKKEDIKHLINSTSDEEFYGMVNATRYGRLMGTIDGNSIERAYDRVMEGMYDAQAKKYPYSMATINKYLYKKENEIKKLTTIIECVKYGIHDIKF